MIVVKVELWPGGDRRRARELTRAVVANDGTGNAQIGRYEAAIGHEGRYRGRRGCWKAVEGVVHRRKRSVWLLLRAVLEALFSSGDRTGRGDRLLELGGEPEANLAEATETERGPIQQVLDALEAEKCSDPGGR